MSAAHFTAVLRPHPLRISPSSVLPGTSPFPGSGLSARPSRLYERAYATGHLVAFG